MAIYLQDSNANIFAQHAVCINAVSVHRKRMHNNTILESYDAATYALGINRHAAQLMAIAHPHPERAPALTHKMSLNFKIACHDTVDWVFDINR